MFNSPSSPPLITSFSWHLLNDDCSVPGDEAESNIPSANEDIVAQLVSMGFSHLHCQKAAINTANAGVEEAMNWLLSHMDDPGT